MAAEKRSRLVEGFYRGIKSHVRLKVYDLLSHEGSNTPVRLPTIAFFLLFLVVLHGLYTTQHKRNANYKKDGGVPQNRQHL